MMLRASFLPFFFSFFALLAYASPPSPRHGNTTDIYSCLRHAEVPYTKPGDAEFRNDSTTYNLHYQYVPTVIISPYTPEHISCALRCATAFSIKVQARGGGHSFASFSTGGANGSMIVLLENFNQAMVVDASTNIATVGAGQRLGDMATALNQVSSRALPHGTCPGVGIGGHATHGGYGFTSRSWGLTLDTIVGMDVVLANGTFTHVDADGDQDLWYALRGAAESFGIVTTFYMQTQPSPASLIYYNAQLPAAATQGIDTAANSMAWLQDFAQNTSVIDRRFTFNVYIDPSTFSLTAVYLGTQVDFEANIKPVMLAGLPTPTSETTQITDWAGIVSILAGTSVAQPLDTTYAIRDAFVAKSLLAPAASPITLDAWTAYFDYIVTRNADVNDGSWYSIVDLYGGADSQINAVPADATAFPHRSSLFDFQNYGYAADHGASGGAVSESVQAFIEGLTAVIPSVMNNVTFAAYINYVDASLSPAEAHAQYYGDATYAKLLRIKREVDPGFLFWNPQAIGTS